MRWSVPRALLSPLFARLCDAARAISPTQRDEGEATAEQSLKREGYRLLARNFTVGRDEADLVFESPDRKEVVVVEVKRSARGFDASERVDRRKLRAQGRLIRFIAAHLRRKRPVRLDIVAVVGSGRSCRCLRHIQAVLQHEPTPPR